MEVVERGTNNHNVGEMEQKISRSEDEVKTFKQDMRLSKTKLHPYSRNQFIYPAHSNYTFNYGHMTPCWHNLNLAA